MESLAACRCGDAGEDDAVHDCEVDSLGVGVVGVEVQHAVAVVGEGVDALVVAAHVMLLC